MMGKPHVQILFARLEDGAFPVSMRHVPEGTLACVCGTGCLCLREATHQEPTKQGHSNIPEPWLHALLLCDCFAKPQSTGFRECLRLKGKFQ